MSGFINNYISIKPVSLDDEKCNGCINCMKRCPTEAIRVRDGKARIHFDRCVGCGECVRVCPTRAKYAECDKLFNAKKYKYAVALACPSIYGQFNNLINPDYILEGLLSIGFDAVYETGEGYEVLAAATAREIEKSKNDKNRYPIIGTACPAVIKLVMFRFDNLLRYLSPLIQPEEIVARRAIAEITKKTGLPREDIGVFVISSCSAKTFELKGGTAVQYIDNIISFKEIYPQLLSAMNKISKPRALSKVGKLGISSASCSYLAKTCAHVNYIAADGIENVINILSEMENGNFKDVDYVELNACVSGCVGGCLNTMNPFAARSKIRRIADGIPYSDIVITDEEIAAYHRETGFEAANILRLSEDRGEALKKMLKINSIISKLPNLDCGGCGAPSCRAFAEDIVNGTKASCRYLGARQLLE